MPTFREDLHTGHEVPLVETDDILKGAVTTDKIADGAVDTDQLAAKAVTTEKIADKAVDNGKLDDWCVDNRTLGDKAVDNRVLDSVSVDNRVLDDGAVDNRVLANEAVTAEKLSGHIDPETGMTVNAAVTESKIQDGAVTTDKISGGNNPAVTREKIADGAVNSDKLSSVNDPDGAAVTAGKIAAGAVHHENLELYSVTGDNIAEKAIDGSNIKDKTIAGINIKDRTIGTDQLSGGMFDGVMTPPCITTEKIADWQPDSEYETGVTTEKIADGAVTEAKLANGAITTEKLATPVIEELQTIMDAEPTAGSVLPVNSGGVFNSVISSGVFDLSAHTGDNYADLSAALTAMNALPAAYKKGGMSIKYVSTYDNKYLQYRYMLEYQNTTAGNQAFLNTANWQDADDVKSVNGGAGDFSISDENNNDIVLFKNGHIKTKEFDSSFDATINNRGLMSAADKRKLDSIEEGAEVNDVETATNNEYDLTIEDEEGYMLVKMQGGYIKTKNFDSEQQTIKLATIEEGAEVNDTLVDAATVGDLNIEDEEGNIVAGFSGGHIKTKNFDSKNIEARLTALEGRVDYNTPSNYLGRDISTFAKIMCIGDSLTEGAFNYLSGSSFGNNTTASLLGRPYSYPQYLAKLTGCEVINLGKSGYTSSQWYDYYTTGEGAGTDFSGYDCAIIQLGVNDNAATLDTVTKTALDNIINKVKTANAGIKIFFAGIINAKSYPAATEGESYYAKDQWLRNYYNTYYANDAQVFFIDHVAYGHLRSLPNSQHGGSYPVDNYNEGHLSAYGYWRLAQDYVSMISYIMHSDQIGKFRKIQFIGTSYECY